MHRLLERQLRKARVNGRLDTDRLLQQVDDAYREADQERRRNDRAVSLMSDELLSLNHACRVQAMCQVNAILDAVYDGVAVLDESGRVLSLNRAARHMFGMSEEVPGALSICDLLPCTSNVPGHTCTSPAGLPVDHGGVCSSMARHRDGREFPVEATLSAVESGDGPWQVVIVRDVTEQRRAQRELQSAREQAETASRTKSRFLAATSHELRTPLNAILGFSDAMLYGVFGAVSPAGYRDYVQAIHDAGRHLLTLVNQVLDLAKIEAGRTELVIESFDPRDMIEAIRPSLEMLAATNSNRLNFDVGPHLGPVSADMTRLSQIMLNVVGNACKFTEHGQVTLSVTRDGGEWLVFTVTDNGIGMSADQVRLLFEAFQQGEATIARRYGGSGLGMSIAAELCRLMGGSIFAASSRGRGTTVTIRLPRHCCAAVAR